MYNILPAMSARKIHNGRRTMLWSCYLSITLDLTEEQADTTGKYTHRSIGLQHTRQ